MKGYEILLTGFESSKAFMFTSTEYELKGLPLAWVVIN